MLPELVLDSDVSDSPRSCSLAAAGWNKHSPSTNSTTFKGRRAPLRARATSSAMLWVHAGSHTSLMNSAFCSSVYSKNWGAGAFAVRLG